MGGVSYLAAAVLCVSVTAGCGSVAGDSPEPRARGTQLEITVWPKGQGKSDPLTTTLSCNPAGGDVADPDAACTAIAAKGASLFEPTPAGLSCTELYGGPQEARVIGSVSGQAVDARFSRKDGCEIARWDAVASFVPVPEWDARAQQE